MVSLVAFILGLLLVALPSKANNLPPGVQEHYISDDGNVHIPLPFPFPYYGRTFTDSWMFSNGVIGFLSPQTSFCCSGADLTNPNNHRPQWNFALMPLWTDLRNYNGRFLTEGTPDYQRYVWENISEFGRPNSENTFGVEIFPSGDWRFYHEKIDITRSFTIGATGDLSLGEYQQFGYFPQGLNQYNNGYVYGAEPWSPSYNGDPNAGSICDVDPLASPSCPGYADAYHEQQCSYDPLYDPTCAGYEQAYLDLQCSYDPLYDTTCEGYADAYYDQQCGLDPLYDVGCTGYAEAYHEQQCSLDPLYDTTCSGYADAYFEYQCSLDALYDTGCAGYAEAVADEYVNTDDTVDNTASTTANNVVDAEQLVQTPVTGDATVDSILRETNDATTDQVVTGGFGIPVPEMEAGAEPEAMREEEVSQEGEQVEEELVALEQSVDEDNTESESSESESQSDGESDASDSEASEQSEREVADGGDSESEKKDRREKIKQAVTKRAMALADQMSNAASFAQQQALQAQILGLINYVPDFNSYQVMMNGGYMPDATGYPDSRVPENRRGLRNGLAQQLLHQQMVDMQYENIQ